MCRIGSLKSKQKMYSKCLNKINVFFFPRCNTWEEVIGCFTCIFMHVVIWRVTKLLVSLNVMFRWSLVVYMKPRSGIVWVSQSSNWPFNFHFSVSVFVLYLQSLGKRLSVQQRIGSEGEDLWGATLPPERFFKDVPQMVGVILESVLSLECEF